MAPELPDLKVAGPSADACLVIDRSQRIVQWSDAAGELLSIAGDSAIGRDCATVVGGCDPSGEPICRLGCPAVESVRDGHPGYVSQMLARRAGAVISVTCNVVPIQGSRDSALITLTEQPVLPEISRRENGSADGILRDLAGVGSLATSIGAESLAASAEHTLDWLCQTLGVEAAELFLREAGSDDMLLSYVRSPFKSAFTQINRFPAGEGYPGLVLSRDDALVTTDLFADRRYLRTRVKDEGFLSYVCVPLRDSDGIIGTLNIAARRSDLDVERAQRVLEWAGVPLARALETASLRARLAALPQPDFSGTVGELETLSRHLLQRLMSVGNATAGELMVHAPGSRATMHRVTAGGIEEPLCGDVQAGDEPPCPALSGKHGIALHGPRAVWQSRCQLISGESGVTHCIPLVAAGEPIGLALLRYNGSSPSPPTNHLTLLLAIATQAAPSVKLARDTARVKTGADVARRSPEVVNGRQSTFDAGEHSGEKTDEPFLKIRCFGSFELHREGRLMPPDAVQRRGAISLLKILLVNEGRAVTRDMLAEALWPGDDPRLTTNRLYVLIHALRRAIEPSSRPHKRRWTFICNDGDRYYLNSEAPYSSDIGEFRGAVASGERQERFGDLRGAVDAYSSALELYRGDLFEDEPYAEWCWAERESLREMALGVATRTARLYEQMGAPDQSIVYYQRALRLDPLREQIHRRLIEVFLVSGRRSEALRQYSVCQELLRQELDIEPMPETQRLFERASKRPS